MVDTPKSLLLQVLTIPPTGSPRDQGIGLSYPKKTQEKDSVETLQESKVCQKDSFQQR